jgi:hypothetical protein
MGPGTAAFNATFKSETYRKRAAADAHTTVTMGNTAISYGNINPSDAVHHLYDICHIGACDRSEYAVASKVCIFFVDQKRFESELFHKFIDPNNAVSEYSNNLILVANGQYDGWDQRDLFVDAVVAAASQGQSWEYREWVSARNVYKDPPD